MSEAELFRRVGSAVETRLRTSGLIARGHVGADVEDAWRQRVPGLPADVSLSWVAFDFPGLSVWDVHLGVLADFGASPARCTVGLHVLSPHWRAALTLLARDEPATARALDAEAVLVSAIHEVQLNDPWRDLDLDRLDEEDERLVARAVELYRLVQPRVVELAARLREQQEGV